MIVKWTELRLLATLRRIAKAMERANELELHRQEMEYQALPKSAVDPGRKKVIISHPSAQRWNDRAAGFKE
jgi:hypothetical protein